MALGARAGAVGVPRQGRWRGLMTKVSGIGEGNEFYLLVLMRSQLFQYYHVFPLRRRFQEALATRNTR